MRKNYNEGLRQTENNHKGRILLSMFKEITHINLDPLSSNSIFKERGEMRTFSDRQKPHFPHQILAKGKPHGAEGRIPNGRAEMQEETTARRESRQCS